MMKSFFKKLAFVMALAMVVSLAAPAATTAAAAENMKITYQNGKSGISELNIAEVGAKEDLKALNAPKNWKELGMKWESSNPAVATVNNSGEVEAKAAGTAVITVTCGDATASVTVYCVDTQTYKVTMGTSSKDLMTEATMEVGGDAIDFAFFGIKDYDQDRYHCTWASTDTSVIKVNGKNGYTEAVGEGTAKVTLIAFNKTTGEVHDVAPCTVTVGAKATPAPAKSVEAKQTTENDLYLTFKGIDVAKLDKSNIEIYEFYADEALVQEYAYQIHKIEVDEDDENKLWVYGYGTSEFVDECTYVVRIVDKDGEVVVEDDFVASVGEVDKVTVAYASYENNQGKWHFEGKAYTNASSGEEVTTKVTYKLWDDEGIDVTGHYQNLYDTKDLVSFEVLTEEADPYVSIDESKDIFTFSDIPEVPVVKFNVIYEDYETGEEVTTPLTMHVEEAPAYYIDEIYDWNITITSTGNNSYDTYWDALKREVALYDDYDLVTGTELMNHEIVLWFTDNYGNKYCTNSAFVYSGCGYEHISASEKFNGEGYEIHYETRNPQVLVVGDDYAVNATTNSSVITTKKVGTAKVNVTLYNVYTDKLIGRTDVLSITVKPQRYVQSVNAESVNVTTDSLPYNGRGYVGTATTDPNNTGNDNQYDPDFTTETVKVIVKDQYGVVWGRYNKTAAQSLVVEAAPTNVDIAAFDIDATDWAISYDDGKYEMDFDGAQVLSTLTTNGSKANSITYKVLVTDILNNAEKSATFRVSLKNPTLDKNTQDIVTKNALQLDATNVSYTSDADKAYGMNAYITVTELSSNGLKVNYAEDRVNKQPIHLITSLDEYNDLFGTTKTTASTKEALYIAVFDPKGKVVDLLSNAGDDAIGLSEIQSGHYSFQYADTKSGSECTRFATAGTYTVKLMEVTSVKSGNLVNTFTTTTKKFTITNDLLTAAVKNQEYIYLDSNDKLTDTDYVDNIVDVAKKAFSYNVSFKGKPYINISDVRYRQNTRANAVVIQDVFMKVKINTNNAGGYTDDSAWYYIQVPVDMTVSLEDINLAAGISVDFGKDPEGRRLK